MGAGYHYMADVSIFESRDQPNQDPSNQKILSAAAYPTGYKGSATTS